MTDEPTSPPPAATLAPLFGTATEPAERGDPVRVELPGDRTAEYVAGETIAPGDELAVDPDTGRVVHRHLHFAGDDAPDDGPARMDWARRQAADARAEALAELDAVPVPTTINPASIAAAVQTAGHVGSQRRAALDAFAKAGVHGLTDDELAVETNMVPNRVATRRKELQTAGLVAPLSAVRPTRSGVDANVHAITALGHAAANHRTEGDQ